MEQPVRKGGIILSTVSTPWHDFEPQSLLFFFLLRLKQELEVKMKQMEIPKLDRIRVTNII